jgi:hypothetical protein
VPGARKVRLLGVYASGFGASQPALVAGTARADKDRVRATIEHRFGAGSVPRARLLRPPAASRGCGDTPPGPAADRKGSRRLRR